MKKKVRIKEPLFLRFIKPFVRFYVYFVLGFRQRKVYHPEKGEKVIVLSNHQTDFDPIFVRLALGQYLYTLSTDNIYSKKLQAKFITYSGGIPKRKGIADIESIMKLLQIARDGGSILIFPEGNRSYAEFQFYIADNFASLLFKLKATIVLYNIHGGFGVNPRFGHKRRKGKFYGEVKKVLKYEEYKDMSVEELNKIVVDNLKVFDSDSGELYKSNARAEYLERMFFLCPKCGEVSTLTSKGNYIKCSHCGLEVEYLENLTLRSDDPEFKYHRLVEWYDYQREYIRNMELDGKVIFEDKDVEVEIVNPYEPLRKVTKGDMKLYKDRLEIGNISLDIHNILSASPMSGRRLCFTYDKDNYQLKCPERFNALKYALIFHKLDTKMHLENLDNYYNI